MLNVGIFLTLSEKKKIIPGKTNSLCTADSQLSRAGEKQSKSLAQSDLLIQRRVQTRLRERFSSQPTPTAALVGRSSRGKTLVTKSLYMVFVPPESQGAGMHRLGKSGCKASRDPAGISLVI